MLKKTIKSEVSAEVEQVAEKIEYLLTMVKRQAWDLIAWENIKKWAFDTGEFGYEDYLQEIFDACVHRESRRMKVSELISGNISSSKNKQIIILRNIIYSDDFKCFLDQDKLVFVKIKMNKRVKKLRIDSEELENWMIKKCRGFVKDAKGREVISKILSLASVETLYEEKKREISRRIEKFQGSYLEYAMERDKRRKSQQVVEQEAVTFAIRMILWAGEGGKTTPRGLFDSLVLLVDGESTMGEEDFPESFDIFIQRVEEVREELSKGGILIENVGEYWDIRRS